MAWFREIAPIRQKMLVLCFTFWALIAGVAAAGLLLPGAAALMTDGALLALAIGIGLAARAAICDPYVTTVVRMEALAAGDLATEIAFTGYRDCVGRMTRAMLTFRDNASAQIALREAADANAAIVQSMSGNIARLAQGDLTATITGEFPAIFQGLKDGFNAALVDLRDLVGNVSQCADTIRGNSTEIAGAAQELAARTESNAASLEQTSAAMAQIDGRLKSSAAAATDTVRGARQAMAAVDDGRQTAQQAMGAMARVSESAKGIDTVIEGLDKIAFQTRVLAMNAAVEAGRAGDAGRGFAVVADLVSALAMRAEEEAKRAREQLTVTQQDIIGAVGQVESVDSALQKISANVTEVQERVAEMADSNRQQAHTASEINAAVSMLDRSTQQNAAMVEETSAASALLIDEVQRLSGLTARFDLGDRGRAVAARPAPRTPASPRVAAWASAASPAARGRLALVADSSADGDGWADF